MEMKAALEWFRNKTDEYAKKSGEYLWEIHQILGPEIYQKCREYYAGEYNKYNKHEEALERFLEVDGAENDLLAPMMDIPNAEEMQGIKEAAERACKFYLKERS